MQPSLWGPHLWKSIHYIAMGYPNEADNMVRASYKEFYLNLWKVVPCLKCSVNYRRHLEELPPIDGFLGSRDDLFKWTVALHNIVNVELGKPQMDVETAKSIYTNGEGAEAPRLQNVFVPAPAPQQPQPQEQIIQIVEKTVGSYLPHNIAIVTLALIICILFVFMIAQKKHASK